MSVPKSFAGLPLEGGFETLAELAPQPPGRRGATSSTTG